MGVRGFLWDSLSCGTGVEVRIFLVRDVKKCDFSFDPFQILETTFLVFFLGSTFAKFSDLLFFGSFFWVLEIFGSSGSRGPLRRSRPGRLLAPRGS